MAFGADVMGAFNVGNQIGQANAPSMVGPQSMMDMFRMQQENAFKLAQTAALFKGEKDWEYQTNPMMQEAALKLKNFGGGGGVQGTGAGGTDSTGIFPPSQGIVGGSNGGKPMQLAGVTNTNPFTGVTQNYKNVGYETQLETAKKASSDLQNLENLKDQSLNIISNGIGNFKQMTQSNPIAQKIGAGRVAGIGNVFGRITGTNPGAAPYESSKTEIATELAKIANPSGRPGPDMIQMYSKLLPDDFSNPQEASNKFANAIHNALARYHGARQAVEVQQGLTPTPYSRTEYDPQVQSILNAPASNQLSMNSNSEEEMVKEALAKRPDAKQAILAHYKQRTGKEFNG